MTTIGTDPRIDRLYDLLPAIYRIRDDELGAPLRDLLRVIAEQVNVVEDDIAGLYDNWFIETAQDWVVPYIGDLIGYRAVSDTHSAAAGRPTLVRTLVPRREVAGTIRAARRKGTLALLEELARDVADWPARAVEWYRLLAVFQAVNHLRLDRGRTVDVRNGEPLDRLDGPFDEHAHTVDIRRIQSAYQPGRFNVPSVGLFVWRLKSYPVTAAPAACIEEISPSAFTFSVLGNDAPLFAAATPEPDADHIATEVNIPAPIRRRALESGLDQHYGSGRSFQIWVGARRAAQITRSPVPSEQLIVADLSGWTYRPRRGTVVVDPLLGRIAFPPGHAPNGVWVSYRYGFSADIGGGEYPRPLPEPSVGVFHQLVGKTDHEVDTIEEALRRWEQVRSDQPVALIEIADSEVYSEQLAITLHRGESLEIRAADRTRPVIYLIDRQRNQPDSLTVTTPLPTNGADEPGDDNRDNRQPGGCLRLDGLLVTGRAVHIEGPLERVQLSHCTLVPGWGLRGDCEPRRPTEPSLELYRTTADVTIERSILGSIQVYADEVSADPTPICITDSILDATGIEREAVGAPNWPLAHATLTLRDCTVIGKVLVHAILLAENSILRGEVRVARRQIGCLRYCAVAPGSRTPPRHHCQPDLVEAALRATPGWTQLPSTQRDSLLAAARLRVEPVFTSVRYGTPGYTQLGAHCAPEVLTGADDGSELGAFHDLYQPQRLANLRTRLDQFSPARTDIAVIPAS